MGLPPRNSVQITPFGVNFGNVVASTSSSSVPVTFTARGTTGQDIVINPSDPRFVAPPSGAMFCPLNTPITVNFQFNANATLGPADALFFSFAGESGYTPGGPTLDAVTVSPGSTSWKITPNPFDFGQIRVGTVSPAQTITVQNTSGSGSLTVNSITAPHPDFALSGLPSLPATLGPGASLTFNVACDAQSRGNISFDDAIVVATTAGTLDVQLLYEGYAITPAFVLLGITQKTLYGLTGVWEGDPTLQLMEGDPTLLEADASWQKVTDFGNPGMLNYINKVFVRTENQNQILAQLADNSVASGQLSIKASDAVQGPNTTELPGWLQFDIENNGESHLLFFTLFAGDGPMIMDFYIITYENRGPVYELNT